MTRYGFTKRITVLGMLLVALLMVLRVDSAEHQQTQPTQTQRAPDWLEPMGINLGTLTGLIPEAELRDAVLVWLPGNGIVTYGSGIVDGANIHVTANYDLANAREVWCMADPPQLDHSSTVQPPSTMRVYSNGNDVTNRVQNSYDIFLAGQNQPQAGSDEPLRYPETTATVQRANDGSIIVPANRGCTFTLNAALPNVTAVFTMPRQDNISITKVYQHVSNVHSYIGPGNAGSLTGLSNQMSARYPNRHDPIVNWFDLTDAQKAAIDSSDYFFAKIPPVSYDMYGGDAAGFGLYRVALNTSFPPEYLSVGHITSKLLPRLGHWRTEPQQQGQQFLDYFQAMYPHGATIYENFDAIKTIETFLPPGLDYQPCMTAGNCSASVLQAVYNHTYRVDTYFYKVERLKDGGLEQVPLLSAGPTYNGRAVTLNETENTTTTAAPDVSQLNTLVYLPFLVKPVGPPPPDNPSACPGSCGWFDEHGQMLDFVPPPSWNPP